MPNNWLRAAWRGNPKDPYAAYVLAEVYLNTGRPNLARKQYEALISMNAQQTVAQGGKRITLVEVANQRLAQIRSAGADPHGRRQTHRLGR